MPCSLSARSLPFFAAVAATLSLAVTSARAQVQIDNVLTVTYGVGNQGSTGLPVVASYDASASDKLVVVVGTEHAFGPNFGMSINSIEYNGQAMVEAVQENTSPGTAAIFYLDNDQCGRDKRCEANAKDAHRLLIEKYGGDQPLLVLDLANWETPFRQVS